MNIAIIGAGILGRTIALRLLNEDCRVTLYDCHDLFDPQNASYAAAGMLAPISESIKQHAQTAGIGTASIQILQEFLSENLMQSQVKILGTTFVAANNQNALVDEVYKSIQRAGFESTTVKDGEHQFTIPQEAVIDPVLLLNELAQKALDKGLMFHQGVVSATDDNVVTCYGNHSTEKFDWVIDVRGSGAIEADPDLRPVRGETVLLYAPNLQVESMLRVQDIRNGFYLVPHRKHEFLLGATEIEHFGNGPTVDTMFNLLGAAYQYHPELRQAEIKGFSSGVRPAYPNNMPRVYVSEKQIYINGMYRHGFLFAPFLAKAVVKFFQDKIWPDEISDWIFSGAKEFSFAEGNVEWNSSATF